MNYTALNVIPQGNEVILLRKCPICGTEVRKSMDRNEFYSGMEKYEKGALVQNAFPNADASLREMLITGICNKCWKSM